MMLGPVLAMVNGPIVADAIKDPTSALNTFIEKTPDDVKVVEQIYLSVLNRLPTKQEIPVALEALHAGKSDLERIRKEYLAKKEAFEAYDKTLDAKLKSFEEQLLKQKPTEWTTLTPEKAESKNGPTRAAVQAGATLTVGKDGTILASGKTGAVDLYTIMGKVQSPDPITAIRIEALTDPSLPSNGPGRAQNGNFVLSELKLEAQVGKDDKPKPIRLVEPQATFQQANFPAANAIDNNRATGWAIGPQYGKSNSAFFKLQQPVNAKTGATLTVAMDFEFGDKHTLGKFRISYTTDKEPKLQSPVPADVVKILQLPTDKRTAQQKDRLRQLLIAQDSEYQRLKNDIPVSPPSDYRVLGGQDLVWALINNPSFLFNR
jgi:hypothetical protein